MSAEFRNNGETNLQGVASYTMFHSVPYFKYIIYK